MPAYHIWNLSNINGTGIVAMTQSVNTELTYGLFGVMLLASLCLIFFISFSRATGEPKRSLSYAVTITGLLSLPLRGLSLISDRTVLIVWVVVLVTIISTILTEQG